MIASAPSLAKKIESLTVGTGRAYFNRRSRKNECSCHKPKSTDRVCAEV